MRTEKTYSTEAELCTAFIDWVKAENGKARGRDTAPVWTPYAETAGWDILLAADDGTQIGIEAKLKFNLKVLAQCLPSSWDNYAECPGRTIALCWYRSLILTMSAFVRHWGW